MPRFSIKRLFVSTTLIALGLGLNPWLNPQAVSWPVQWTMSLFFLSPILVGTGVGTLLKIPEIGVLVGLGFCALTFWMGCLKFD